MARNPSKAWLSGWIAFTYVTTRNADCESPAPMIVAGRRSPSRFAASARAACAAWVKMS